jgi:hypothetical protein
MTAPARAAAGLAAVDTVPGRHLPQEDQAPAIARKIARLALGPAPGFPAQEVPAGPGPRRAGVSPRSNNMTQESDT